MRHNIVSLKLKYNHGTTEYRGIFSRYLPWNKISGIAQHYSSPQLSADNATVQHQVALLLHGDYTKWAWLSWLYILCCNRGTLA